MRIVFIGPPGAGKGTQCRRLSDHLSIPHLSTGDMLRQTRGESALGKVVSSFIDSGRLAPDYLVMPIVTKRLSQRDCRPGCLFDGFPRTVNQAEKLGEFLAESGDRVGVVIDLDAPAEELIARLLKRAQIENRADDTADTIAARLDVFAEQTAPVLGYYRQQGIVQRIDALGSPEQVFSDILKAIDYQK